MSLITVTLVVEDAVALVANDTMIVNVLTVDNVVPVANAGADQIVDQGDVVTFDGSASTDNVAVTNYTWTFVYDDVNQTLDDMVNPTFTFDTVGVYTVTLTVKDAAGLTDTDTVNITVVDVVAPVAEAGPDALPVLPALSLICTV